MGDLTPKQIAATRRAFLARSAGGMGSLALSILLREQLLSGQAHGGTRSTNPLEPQPTHHAPRVKRVIWLFMHGGPSHVDLFDPKPDLIKYSGKPLPDSFGMVMTRRKVAQNPLLGPVRKFQQHGESGLPVSEFLPHIAACADDLCVIRSVHGDSVNHPQSVYQMNTGRILMGHPSIGSWISYGLGTENQNMPAFVVLPDPGGGVKGGPPAWGSGFLPAAYQGTTVRPGKSPILNLRPPENLPAPQQRKVLDLLARLNQRHLAERDFDDELSARINAYELAYRMQTAAPDLVDLGQETQETLDLYGIGQKHTDEFGTRCLLARRFVEQGVRFVQIYSGNTNGWDAHSDVDDNHSDMCRRTDLPVAGLLRDLKRRGLWEDTLVVWAGEFGRMPMSERGKGRDHNPWGYSVWLAGGGVRGGLAYGSTDPVGLRAAENPVPVKNLHATILHLLGLDHEQLTFLHNGLDQRLTGPDEAHVVHDILA